MSGAAAGPTFCLQTYGCQMNERDSDAAAALLARHGFTRAGDARTADVFLVNSCSIRGKAEDKALGRLRQAIALRRRAGRSGAVAVMGCMAQRLGPALPARVPGIDVVIGTRRLASLPGALHAALAGRGPVVDTAEERGDPAALAEHAAVGVSAFVNILFGCNRRCAYCVVPAVRGGEWSRPAADVLAEVRALAAAGVREVTLLGQSVMAYGRATAVVPAGSISPRGFSEPLPALLDAIDALPGLARVRFTSGHPDGCTPELLRAMAELGTVCEHLHVPLQSGSDRILAAMGRGYTVESYLDAVRRVRAAVPGVALTTDAIVGFPGETAEDFEATRRVMDAAAFDNSYIFQYSPRDGTRAAALGDDVPAAEKKRRNHVLLDDQNRRGLALHQRWIGTTLEVLVEGQSARNAGRWTGRTRTNVIVLFEPSLGVRPGDLLRVRIERAMPQTLYGSESRGGV